MLGKTHRAFGVTTALVITQPITIPALIGAVIGGTIGGELADIDNKEEKVDKEYVYDTIINYLFIGALFFIDYYIGNGMMQYIKENMGIRYWGGLALFGILMIISHQTKHRTFTHSLLGTVAFCIPVYLFCKPIVLPFLVGYVSHLFLDIFNKQGLQLFFPLKWKICLNLCSANKKANRYIRGISTIANLFLIAFLFSSAITSLTGLAEITQSLNNISILGLNKLELYLIFINLITFLGMQKNFKNFLNDIFDVYEKGEVYNEEEHDTPESRFEIWLLNFGVFIGGGLGMLLSLMIHLAYPSKDNSNLWSFCYASIMFWGTVYLYICNPFGFAIQEITWFTLKHIPMLMYILIINGISALIFYLVRNKKFNGYSIKHTFLWLLGAFGGTLGAMPIVIVSRRQGTYFYVVSGFMVMLVSQIVFLYYLMSVGIV